MKFARQMQEGIEAAAAPTSSTPSAGTGSNLRANITYILVATWVILILGQAFGLISPEYRPDAVLVASVGVILAYFFESKIAPAQTQSQG